MGVVVRWSFGAGVFLCVHGRRAGVRVDEREWAGAAAAIDGAVRRVRTDNCGASFASFEASYYKTSADDGHFSLAFWGASLKLSLIHI